MAWRCRAVGGGAGRRVLGPPASWQSTRAGRAAHLTRSSSSCSRAVLVLVLGACSDRLADRLTLPASPACACPMPEALARLVLRARTVGSSLRVELSRDCRMCSLRAGAHTRRGCC